MTEENFSAEGLSISLHDMIQQAIDETHRELRNISPMLDQSQVEVEKLSQRNATITMHLQQVEGQIEDLPITEVKNAYDAALDAQQRLVGMRGQLEKLQSDQAHLDRHLAALRELQRALDGDAAGLGGSGAIGQDFSRAESLIQAQEIERKRLSKQMHDGPAQALSNFILQTEIATRLFEIDQEKARSELATLKDAASKSFQQVRDFIFDLRPMMLDDLGLGPTIKQYCATFQEKHKIDVDVIATGNVRRLESFLEVLIFRAMQELLKFAVENNQASDLRVFMDMGDQISLAVEDNGNGVTPEKVGDEEAALSFKVIGERAAMLGGEFNVDCAEGEGARISLILPDIPPSST
jgi:two-component system sensor histidine kinase DegS